MKQLLTQGIVLGRIDYGEADRIITILTPDYGKLSLMAKGVRRVKSRLAGGIELFSVSDITFIRGRGEVGTLISTRLKKHYGHITESIERVQLAYDLIKILNKVTEDEPESEYFELLEQTFVALDDAWVANEVVRLWFFAQLLRLGGHAPNLNSDTIGHKLEATEKYNFDFEAMTFAAAPRGRFKAEHIKVLRLLFGKHAPRQIQSVGGTSALLADIAPLIQAAQTSFLAL